MARLLAVYNQPADPAAFDAYYFGTHMPLFAKVAGIRKVTINTSSPVAIMGPAPYRVTEVVFDSMADIDAAVRSPEGQAAAADLKNFAGAGAVILVYDTREA